MARPIEFNKEEVIERAMMLFWEKGYEATSVRDLNKGMGISSSSMYESFGDKRSIFLLALARFCEIERMSIAQKAEESETPQAFIKQLFGAIDEGAGSEFHTGGSLALKTMNEFGTGDAAITHLLLTHFLGIADIIAAVLAQGQARGTVANRTPPLELAYTILSTLYGVVTLKGVKPDFAFIPAMTQIVLQLLNP